MSGDHVRCLKCGQADAMTLFLCQVCAIGLCDFGMTMLRAGGQISDRVHRSLLEYSIIPIVHTEVTKTEVSVMVKLCDGPILCSVGLFEVVSQTLSSIFGLRFSHVNKEGEFVFTSPVTLQTIPNTK